tara:strand:- start:165 stop:911 length:747 start_codon:yes stop_codon:yes gene_type:complete
VEYPSILKGNKMLSDAREVADRLKRPLPEDFLKHREEQRTKDYVYIIYCQELGLSKIGISNDPEKRVSSLQTAMPFDLIVGYKLRTFDRSISRCIEQSAHRMLREYLKRGEWFMADIEHAAHSVGMVVELLKMNPHSIVNYSPLSKVINGNWYIHELSEIYEFIEKLDTTDAIQLSNDNLSYLKSIEHEHFLTDDNVSCRNIEKKKSHGHDVFMVNVMINGFRHTKTFGNMEAARAYKLGVKHQFTRK